MIEFVLRESDTRLEGYRLNPGDIEEHAAIEQSVIDGGYGHRQLFELIQNAADAIRAADSTGRVELRLTPESLYVANEGSPVDEEGADSILRSHISTKRSHEIGHFGLGFKSVLGISERIAVFSRLGSFGFDTTAARARILASVPGYAKQTPGLRIAHALDAEAERARDPILDELAEWASTVIRLSRDHPRAQELGRDLAGFPAEFLLFSPHVTSLHMEERAGDFARLIVLTGSEDGRIELDDTAGEPTNWVVFRDEHTMSEEAKRDAGEMTARDRVEIAWAVPLARRSRRGRYWAFFPTTYESTLSGILNAPWKTNSDRQGLLEGRYNSEIIEAAAELVSGRLTELHNPEDHGAHLDLLPARIEDAAGWANRELTDQIDQRAAKLPILPDSEGVLRQPDRLTLIPPTAGEVALDIWRGLERRPGGWAHEQLNSRERRPRAIRLGAHDADADTWLAAIAEPATPAMSVAAIRASAGCAREPGRGTELAGRRASIVLTEDGRLVAPDSARVFFSGADRSEVADLLLVHPEVAADPGARRILTERFGLKEVDSVRELEVLLAESATLGFSEWDRVWAAARRASLSDITPNLRQHMRRIKVRTLAGAWRRAWEVLLPGPIVPGDGSRDRDVTVDLAYHRDDGEALSLLGVVDSPAGDGLARPELAETAVPNWQSRYRNLRVEAFQQEAHLASGRTPQAQLITSRDQVTAGPLSPYFRLSNLGRELFVQLLLPLAAADPAVTWRHTGTTSEYPEMEAESPARWLIRESDEIPTTLGPRPVARSVDSHLDAWSGLLPVAPAECAFLCLPGELPAIPADVLGEAHELALSDDDLPEAPRFYAELALEQLSAPARIRAAGPDGPSRLPPGEVTVTSDPELAGLLVQDGPVLLVSTGEQAQALVTEWGLKPATESVERSVQHAPSGPAVPLADAFPGLPRAVLAEHGDVDLVPCGALWSEVRTARGEVRSDLESHYAAHERAFLYRDARDGDDDGHQFLSALLSALSVELPEGAVTVADAISHNMQAAQSKRIAAIKAISLIPGKLAEMFGEAGLRRHLPRAVLDAESGSRAFRPDELAGMILAVHGSAALRMMYRDDYTHTAPTPPRRWAGSDPALRFVRALGFPDEFAGAPARARPPFIEVDGPVQLGPLHDFQEEIAGNIAEFLRESPPGRGLISLPTGAGKTRVVTETLTRSFVEGVLDGCVLWLADREELCEQAVQSWREVWMTRGPAEPLRISRLWGSTNDRVEDVQEKNHVVVATFQSLVRRIERTNFDWLTRAACVVIDEAHGSVTPSYTTILNQFGLTPRDTRIPLVGLTATPFRGGAEEGGAETTRLVRRYGGRRFDHSVFGDDGSYPRLRQMGVLSDAEFDRLEGVPFELSEPELEQFRQFDRLPANVEARIGRDHGRNDRIIERIATLPREWPALVFAASVDHAEWLAAELSVRGITAQAVSSRTDPVARRHAIEGFRRNEIQVLTNFGVLTTGFDAPKTRAVFVTRPIYSPGLYQQVVGRGLRGPANGGTDSCLIVNVADNLAQYGTELAFLEFENLWRRVRGALY